MQSPESRFQYDHDHLASFLAASMSGTEAFATVSSGECPPQPLVSIVIPTYNQAEYLAIAIDSVLAQDYQNVECIVIDDGSIDGTAAVLESYKGLVTCVRQDNGGQSRALNHGWSRSRGELLGYLSSDDRLLPHAVTALVAALREHKQAVVAYGDFDLIDATGRVIRLKATEEFSEARMTEDLECLPGVGALFRRDVFVRAGGWREDLRQYPDLEYWLRALAFGPFVRVGANLAQFRIHEESASFRPVPASRSDEILGVAKQFWEGRNGRGRGRAIAASYLKSARSHAQSGRFFAALARMMAACRHSPLAMCAIQPWRLFLFGFLRAFYYRHMRRQNGQ